MKVEHRCSARFRSVMVALAACGFTTIAALRAAADDDWPAPPELRQRVVALDIDSGPIRHEGDALGEAWATTIHVPDATGLRLFFDEVMLSGDIARGANAFLRITSIIDGASQELNAANVSEWRRTTAYFNGDQVRVQLFAHPGVGVDRVRIGFAWAGEPDPGHGTDTICGPLDDRVLSQDPRSARVLPVGCTVFMIDDANRCFLTAGHCASGGNLDVVQFNVPLSDAGGNLRHPGPEDQYAVDATSIQFTNGGVGNDWCYFGCFPNTETDLWPFQAQGDWYIRANSPPNSDGRPIRITGYGTDNTPPEHNQAQQTHAGPYFSFAGTTIQYQTDTTGGNSGSGVQDDNAERIIGIHTHGGCNSGGGANSGTGINHSGLQDALANPRGVCRPGLEFQYPGGRPDFIRPDGSTSFIVRVVAINGGEHQPDTGILFYDNGSGFTQTPLTWLGDGDYLAEFPPLPCGSAVEWYVSAETTSELVITDPFNAPADVYLAPVASSVTVTFADDFETNQGWTVENVDLADGAWQRGVPAGDGSRGDPTADADGSGQCYLTDNAAGNSDVDGGPTRLISPVFSLADQPNAVVSFARWFTNDDRDIDRFDVHLSNDGGATWTLVESHGHFDGWQTSTFVPAEFLAPTAAMRLRFSATDNPNDSVTEGGIDAVLVRTVSCDGTEITGIDVTTGTLLGGGLAELALSDDVYVHTRSGFGNTFIELHKMDLVVEAATSVASPSSIDLSFESRVDTSAGTARVSLRDWGTGQYTQVGQFALGSTDAVAAISNVPAVDYVSGAGGIDMRVQHLVFVPIFAYRFESFIDVIRIDVE
jgi:V8-like Glu-specific endopeptidase